MNSRKWPFGVIAPSRKLLETFFFEVFEQIHEQFSLYSGVGRVSPPVVWVVDDDRGVARALEMWLAIHGVGSQAFSSAEAALTALQTFDVSGASNLTAEPAIGQSVAIQGASARLVGAVVDLNLPGQSGIAVLRAMRERAPGMPLVLMTALPPSERARHGQPPCGVVCLKKPFDLDALESGLFGQANLTKQAHGHGQH